MSSSEAYVDLYLLPVPADAFDAYTAQASTFGAVVREHGALSYREFRVDDPGEGFATGDGLVQTAAVAGFSSRAHRDEVMGKVMADPRVTAFEGDTVADMNQMRYGGFETFVDS